MRELGSNIASRFTIVLMVLVVFAILLWNFLASDSFCADGLSRVSRWLFGEHDGGFVLSRVA